MSFYPQLFTSATVLTLLGFQVAWQPVVQAQSNSGYFSLSQTLSRLPFPNSFMPPGDGVPDDTTTAGSRTEAYCRGDDQPIKALVPVGNYGLTYQDSPVIHLEMSPSVAKQIFVAVHDEQGQLIASEYQTIQALNASKSVRDVRLPSFQPFEIGKNYRWSVAVLCQGYLDPSDPFFSAWFQKVAPMRAASFQSLPSQQKFNWLVQEGYWYDAVKLLVDSPL